MSETITDRALDLIRKAGKAGIRTDALAAALECAHVPAILKPKCDDGTLVFCKVTNPTTGRAVNEYRLSVAGGGHTTGFSELSIDGRAGRGLAAARAAQETARALRKPAGANGHDRDQAKPPAPAAPEVPVFAETKPLPEAPTVRGAALAKQIGDGKQTIGAIEKGVPIPVRNNNGPIRAALLEMEPGDSRVMTVRKQTILYAAQKAGLKVATRTEGDHTRVWLVSK